MEILAGILFIGIVAFFAYKKFKSIEKGDDCCKK